MKRVLVTRPEPAASKTARKLEAMGFAVVLMPLTQVVPITVDPAGTAGDLDAVAATSANAVIHASDGLIGRLKQLPAYAVGARTGAIFKIRGFKQVEIGDGGGEALARRIAEGPVRPDRVAYLCGRVRTPDFEARLNESHIGFIAIETYDTQPVPYEAATVEAVCRSGPVDAVLLYSAGAGRLLAGLMERNPRVKRSIGEARFHCISRKVASALPGESGVRADFADQPTEEALFDLLRLS